MLLYVYVDFLGSLHIIHGANKNSSFKTPPFFNTEGNKEVMSLDYLNGLNVIKSNI